jgi:hypothetical protein
MSDKPVIKINIRKRKRVGPKYPVSANIRRDYKTLIDAIAMNSGQTRGYVAAVLIETALDTFAVEIEDDSEDKIMPQA